jgi:rhodanese-related sulfurtransferase
MSSLDKNEKALLVGFLLIIIIVMIFVSKNYATERNFPEDKSTTTLPDNSKKLAVISDEDLAKIILERKPLSILDMRDPLSFKNEHIINSLNASGQDLLNSLSSKDKNKTYVIVDYTGENSTVNIPENIKDTSNVFLLTGGFTAWKSNHNRTISSGDPNLPSDQSKISYVNCDDLKKMTDGNSQNLYILDVRDKDSFTQNHIKNSNNIYLDEIEKRYKEIPLGKKIIVYDNNGFSAFQAGVRLFDLGVINVFTLSDGLTTWQQKGFEVVNENH